MTEWKEVKLGDVCDVITKGTTPSNIGDSFVDEGIKFIRSEMLGRDKYINNSGFLFISEETHQRLRRSQLKEKDILFSMAGVYLGKTAILRKEDVPSNTNQAVAIIRVNGTKADVEYIYYCLNHPHIVKTVNASCAQSAQPNINLKQIGEISFLTPPLGIQQRIASILSSLDDKIAVNRRICENLEAQAQALFKNWFVDFAPFKNGKFVESELGMIPEGWRVGRLGEVADITSGKRPPKKSKELNDECNIPLIGAADIMGYTSSILYKSPILIIGRVGTHGVVQRWKDACWPSDNTLVIESQYYNFTYQQLKNIDYSSINRGSTQPLITQTDVKNTSIIIPTRQTLEKYESIINILYDSIYRNNKESARLATLRDTLLPKLMSGQIKL